MDVLEAIITRRSIRRFTSRKIEDEKIVTLLKAAMYAPSARNRQPWQFLVVDDRALFNAIMEIHPYAQMLKEASHAVVVLGDHLLEHGPGYWAVDCGAATQNLLLAAHGMGLGGVWLGLHPREERKKGISKLFGLPGHIEPFALVALGHPAEQKDTPERFHPERIHYNHWQQGK